MAAMGKAGIRRLKFKKDDYELELEKEGGQEIPQVPLAPAPVAAQQHRDHEIPAATHPPHETESKPAVADGTFVTSPMVGTFYTTPSPEDPPFVKVGDRIESDSVVCIVEAMKVMNEVKAGVSGVVSEVLVENGHPVEFGSKLFRVK